MNYEITYKSKTKRRGKSFIWKKKKKVKISGKLKERPVKGTFISRFGTRIHGVKFTYVNIIPNGAGRGGRIKRVTITKIVNLPKNAFDVKVRKC